jgi:regulator of replication initiation timing
MNEQDVLTKLQELERRVEGLEQRVHTIEQQIVTTLDHFGDYKTRTTEELTLMGAQVDSLLQIVEALVETAENEDTQQRARRLRARLRNNQTRIAKAVEKKAAS